jgi:anti-sigma28 factor (negative regulator of flagellin synthesis)
MKVTHLQEQIGRGEYHVDAHAVADAIVQRILAGRISRTAEDSTSA